MTRGTGAHRVVAVRRMALHRLRHSSGASQRQTRLGPDACRPTPHNSPKTLPCAARAARCATSRRGAPAPRSRRSFGLTKDCSCKLRSENPATVARREGGVSTARVPKRSGGLWTAGSGSVRTPRAARWSRARGRTSTRPRVCRADTSKRRRSSLRRRGGGAQGRRVGARVE